MLLLCNLSHLHTVVSPRGVTKEFSISSIVSFARTEPDEATHLPSFRGCTLAVLECIRMPHSEYERHYNAPTLKMPEASWLLSDRAYRIYASISCHAIVAILRSGCDVVRATPCRLIAAARHWLRNMGRLKWRTPLKGERHRIYVGW